MVGFISEPSANTIEDVVQASKLNNSKDPHPVDFFESKSNELSLADSFLDFDSISKWFEELPDPVMAGAEIFGSEADENRPMVVAEENGEEIRFEHPIVQVSNSVSEGFSVPVAVKVEPILHGSEPVVGYDSGLKFISGKSDWNGNSNCSIVQGMENVNLVRGSESLIPDGVKAVKSEVNCPADSDDISSDSESSSSSSFSIGSSSSSSSGGDDDDNNDSDDDDDSEDQEEKKDGAMESKQKEDENVSIIKRDIDVEVDMEEGEIRDDEGRDHLHEDINGNVDQMVGWSDVDEDDEADGDGKGGPIMSKNELKVLPPVPQVDVILQPQHNMLPVGLVLSILGAQVIVEGVENHNPLNEGSILWITERRSPLGLVDEIFGPVKNPYYVVRYNCKIEVPTGIQEGTSISFVPEFVSHVLNEKNLHKKGYDASGVNDEELSDEAEFSDDEKEAEYKRMQQMTKRGFNDQKATNRNDNRKKKNGKGPWNNDRNNSRQRQIEKVQPAHAPRQHMSSVPSSNYDGGSSSSVVGQGLISRTNSFQPRQRQIDEVRPAHAQSQRIMPSVPSSDYTGGSSSSMAGPGLISQPNFQPNFASPFQPISQPTNFTTNSNPNPNPIWTAGKPLQQQQSPSFLPPNGMPWMNPNPHQQSYEMQILNTVAGITYLQGLLSQHGLNQTTMQMGLPSQPSPLTNIVGPGIHPSGLPVHQSQVIRPPGTTEAQPFEQNQVMTSTVGSRNSEPAQQFNFGTSPSRGRNPRGRRGHSRGGRGWQRR